MKIFTTILQKSKHLLTVELRDIKQNLISKFPKDIICNLSCQSQGILKSQLSEGRDLGNNGAWFRGTKLGD